MSEKQQTPAGTSGGRTNGASCGPTSAADGSTERDGCQTLSPRHLAMLRQESGISDEVIQARGYCTITDREELRTLSFSRAQCRVPGLLLPLHTTDGGNTLYVYRPDNPRVVEQKRKRKLPDGTYPCKVIKYEFPRGTGTRLDCPPVCQPMLADPSIPLWITEGQKKADALASRGLCAIALLGVWNWRGRNPLGGTTVLTDFDYVAFDNRDVRLVFDSDVTTKPEVRKALDRLTEHLQRKKAHVGIAYLPGGREGKVGVDDWLAKGHTVEELEALVDGPRPNPKPAQPLIELLDTPPPTMRRPLALIDGRAYAAVWLPTRITVTEGEDKRGNIVRYDPPKVETSIRLFIVRDDGAVFGEGVGASDIGPMADLGIEVILPEIPPFSRTWSTAGVKSYRAGQRPDPADVFERIVVIVGRFIDFERSLADQRTMAEMVACYVLATWFLDAFNVIGYVWPNGERGSGKTQLLYVIVEIGFLGQVLLAGGSYATLRDLADYGATLAFDDAENLADPRSSDPDKRALLLAGNRRGSTVTVKEPGPDRTWRTRYVNAFCPRLFSAIHLPDNVLSSRTIVIPLIRTPDPYRANVDCLDYETWPHDRRQLIDDLWALALAHLAKMRGYERAVSEKASLTGRNLEPWRAILAVAAWLDDNGVSGLWERMETLSVRYQEERVDLETGDVTALVIRALCKCAISAISAISATNMEIPTNFVFETAKVTEAAKRIMKDEDGDPESITSQRVGRAMGRMRLAKVPRPGGKGGRQWKVTLGDLESLTKAYGLKLPDTLLLNGTNGTAGTVAHDDGDQSERATDPVRGSEQGEPEDLERRDDEAPPMEPCRPFGTGEHRVFWRDPENPAGGWVCAICHPPHPDAKVETWEIP